MREKLHFNSDNRYKPVNVRGNGGIGPNGWSTTAKKSPILHASTLTFAICSSPIFSAPY